MAGKGWERTFWRTGLSGFKRGRQAGTGHIDAPITILFMTQPPPEQKQALRRYRSLTRQLAAVGWISQGSVQDRTDRQGGGAGYQWTRKVAGKTVTVALTPEQYHQMKEAITNQRRLKKLIAEMEKESRRTIFAAAPHQRRRKRLSKKVLGTI
jgi:hypothetical protein